MKEREKAESEGKESCVREGGIGKKWKNEKENYEKVLYVPRLKQKGKAWG